MQGSSFHFGTHRTPQFLKNFIAVIATISLLSPIITYYLYQSYGLSGPQAWLSLSLKGFQNGWFWQPITYFFIQTTGMEISLSMLLSLFFLMLLLWFTGSEIIHHFGKKRFLFLFFSAGIFSGLIGLGLQWALSSPTFIAGSSSPIFGLFVVWAMIYPDMELYFLFFLRLKAKSLILALLALTLLVDIAYGHYISFFIDLSAMIWSYFFGLFLWKLSPLFPSISFKKLKGKKILDITEMEDDDRFMDRMLEKISKRGESSLSEKERERMRKISQKRR